MLQGEKRNIYVFLCHCFVAVKLFHLCEVTEHLCWCEMGSLLYSFTTFFLLLVFALFLLLLIYFGYAGKKSFF